jgi:hypothetical protein
VLTNVVKWSWVKCSEVERSVVKVLVTRRLLLLEDIQIILKLLLIWLFITFFYVLLVPFCIIVYMVGCFVWFCLIL